MTQQYTFFATCPRLVEGLLLEELKALGATQCRETVSGVYFTGPLALGYNACLWSRIANHVLLPLATIDVFDQASLYKGVQSIDWSEHFSVENTFKVDFSGQSTVINNTQYGARAVKDAIVDQFRAKTNARPSVETHEPDIRVHAHLYGDKINIGLNLSGESLHRRGYRLSQGVAPIKENLAAALLIRSGWAKNWQDYAYLIDPMCGSGTLLIEAALMALDWAPGLLRQQFGFESWLQHDAKLWADLWEQASQRQLAGIATKGLDLIGFDADPRAVVQARDNIGRAGLSAFIDVRVRALSELSKPTHHGHKPGFIITNPPYGERLGDSTTIKPLYQYLGQRLRAEFTGWTLALFTGNPELGKVMGIRARKQYAFLNGAIECKLLMFTISPEWFVNDTSTQSATINYELTPEAEMFANRLRKNYKALRSWIKNNNIECFRVYDADMPEYAVAIDCYAGYAHVQEYAPPKTIDPEKAQQRLAIAQSAIPAVLGIPPERIYTKQRRQQKDFSQYQKMDDKGNFIQVQEGPARFWVNLSDYLDTGLFLDHRPLRAYLASLANNKRVLNLYCYTATATVQAALAGAFRSVSVDMSHTYTAWARRNLALNGISESVHKIVQGDCMRWLDNNDEQFDLIFLDPPTFSRSKRMEEDFDIQRDHIALIRKVLRHLTPEGTLLFSTNFRKFKLDIAALLDLSVTNITPRTFDKDFMRDLKLHQCFEIKKQR